MNYAYLKEKNPEIVQAAQRENSVRIDPGTGGVSSENLSVAPRILNLDAKAREKHREGDLVAVEEKQKEKRSGGSV